MTGIEGFIRTWHKKPLCVAGAVKPDNLASMQTRSSADAVVTEVRGTQLRSVIASVDDYLMNIIVAEDLCNLTLK